MIPFAYHNAESIADASARIDHDKTQAIAGGTTMVDLMKLNVLTPANLVHLRGVLPAGVKKKGQTLTAGAATTMAEFADAEAGGKSYPVIRQSLILAASPQIRNMATLGGNLLQRPRSSYFRHPDMPVEGRPIHNFGADVDTSLLAVLGNQGRLVGMYPGDFGVTAVAFDAELELVQGSKKRRVKLRDFYRTPPKGAFTYHTDLQSGELITAVHFPITPMLKNSFYLKVRDRSSYAFALASAAVGLDISEGRIRAARIGLGGLGSIPWHSNEAEEVLTGSEASDEVFERAANAALAPANPPAGLEYKVKLASRTLVRALQTLRDHGPLNDDQLWAMQHGRDATTASPQEAST